MPSKNALIATAVASLFLSGAALAEKTKSEKKASTSVRCGGINECKGHGSCKSAHNACKGQNGCKGQGFTETSLEQCKDKGGKVLAEK